MHNLLVSNYFGNPSCLNDFVQFERALSKTSVCVVAKNTCSKSVILVVLVI